MTDNLYILPSELDCPFCNKTLELDNDERINGILNCPICGNTINENNYLSKEDLVQSVSKLKPCEIVKKYKIFHNDDEILTDTLGSGFLSSLFVQKSFSKSVLFCSNKRVYQKGKIFKKNIQGSIIYSNVEKIIDIKDITGLNYYIDDPIYRFKFIGLTFILALLCFFLAQNQRGDFWEILYIISTSVGGFLIGLTVLFLFIYGLKKSKWFVIEYAGGMMMTNCNWYSKKSIKRFIKNISQQKDKINQVNSDELNLEEHLS